MSFFAVPPEVWPAMRDRLPRPLTRDEAKTDLRYWQDRELMGADTMPAYRVLGASWGWSASPEKDCKRARTLVANHLEWGDPLKLEKWKAHRGIVDAPPAETPEKGDADKEGRNEGAEGAHEGRNEGATPPAPTPNIDDKGRNEGAEGAQAGRTKGDTRDPFPQSQTPPPSPRPTRARAKAEEGPAERPPARTKGPPVRAGPAAHRPFSVAELIDELYPPSGDPP